MKLDFLAKWSIVNYEFSVQYSAPGFGKGGDFILVFDHAEFVTPALGGRHWIWTEWMNLGHLLEHKAKRFFYFVDVVSQALPSVTTYLLIWSSQDEVVFIFFC